MNIRLLLLTISLMLFQSSKSQPSLEAIQNAIMDFSKSGNLFKKDSVFSVSITDTVYNMILEKNVNGNVKWIRGKAYPEMIVVSIIAEHNQFLLTKDIKVGSIGKLPSCFIEKNGKLFFWRDDNKVLSDETLSVFLKYKLLKDDENGKIEFPDFATNDAQKGAFYYFCKDDLAKYKKVITNKSLGYYRPPKLNCKQ